LADPYFTGLANSELEPTAQPISKLEFEFERRKLARDDVRELIYREVLLVNCAEGIIVIVLLMHERSLDFRVPSSDVA
jgi:hypothetical protein